MIIEGDPLSEQPPISRSRRRPLFIGALVVLVAAIAAGFLARDIVVRTVVLRGLERRLGANVTAASVRGSFGAYAIDGLHVHTAGLTFDAARVTVRSNPLAIVLDAPHAQIERSALYVPDAPVMRSLAWLAAGHARLRVDGGTLEIAPDASDAQTPAPLVGVEEIDGTADIVPGATAYDVHAVLVDGRARYPFAAQALRRNGAVQTRASADALPLAPLDALLSGDRPVIAGGVARGVAYTDDGTPSADATLAGVALRDGSHTLRDLHGRIALRGDAFGSGDLEGRLEGARVTFAGTLHGAAALGSGLGADRDLRLLERLVAIVAGRPGLHDVRLEATAPGIAFAQYAQATAAGPRVISLVAVDPAEPTVHFRTAIASNHVISRGERTSQLAQRIGAVAGVNGDYFDIGRTYEPQGLLVRDGRLVRGPTDRAALLVDRANDVRFAEFHLRGSVSSRGRRAPVTQLNTWPPGPGDVTVISPEYGAAVAAAAGVTFVRLAPVDAVRGEYEVTSIEPAGMPVRVSFGIGIGPGSALGELRSGDRVALHYGLVPAVRDVVAGVGGGPILVRNGAWYEDPHAPAPAERDVRWPVIALGSLPGDLLLFTAVDGRHPDRAVGMTRPEFSALLRSFGVRDAMALDSGGSVTLVTRAPGDAQASVRNTPSDDSAERYVSDGLFVMSSAPPDRLLTPTPAPSAAPAAVR